MTEGMTTTTPMTSIPSQQPTMENSFEHGESRSGDVFESVQEERVDNVLQEGGITDERKGDKVLEFVKEHGIEEGFEFVANGYSEEVSASNAGAPASDAAEAEVSEGEVLEQQETLPIAKDSDGIEKVDTAKEEKKDTPDTEETELQKEFNALQQKVLELTEGQEELRKQVDGVTTQLADTMEITKQTVATLYELVKKLYEGEEDKKRKNSLFVLLVKLTGFIATSLMAGVEEGEKVLKKST